METLTTETKYKVKIFDIRTTTIRKGEVQYEGEIAVHNTRKVFMPLLHRFDAADLRR